MTKSDIQPRTIYWARIGTGARVPVAILRIETLEPHDRPGTWFGTSRARTRYRGVNLKTGRDVALKSAQRIYQPLTVEQALKAGADLAVIEQLGIGGRA